MTTLVDTSVWSLALRRRTATLSAREERVVSLWRELINVQQAALIGIVRQEILSGVKNPKIVETLAAYLNDMPYLHVSLAEHDLAAQFYNECSARGIAASAIDMLICAAAAQAKGSILTVDKDFERYASVLPVSLTDTG